MLLNSSRGKSISKRWKRNVQFKHHKKDFSAVLQSDKNNIGVGTGVGKMNMIKIVTGLGTSSVYYIFERKDDQVLKEKRKSRKSALRTNQSQSCGTDRGSRFCQFDLHQWPWRSAMWETSSKIEKNGIYWRKCKKARKQEKYVSKDRNRQCWKAEVKIKKCY